MHSGYWSKWSSLKTNDLDVASSFLLFFLFQLPSAVFLFDSTKKIPPLHHFKQFLFYSFLIVRVCACGRSYLIFSLLFVVVNPQSELHWNAKESNEWRRRSPLQDDRCNFSGTIRIFAEFFGLNRHLPATMSVWTGFLFHSILNHTLHCEHTHIHNIIINKTCVKASFRNLNHHHHRGCRHLLRLLLQILFRFDSIFSITLLAVVAAAAARVSSTPFRFASLVFPIQSWWCKLIKIDLNAIPYNNEHAINWIDNIYEIVCMIFTLQVKFKFYILYACVEGEEAITESICSEWISWTIQII